MVPVTFPDAGVLAKGRAAKIDRLIVDLDAWVVG